MRPNDDDTQPAWAEDTYHVKLAGRGPEGAAPFEYTLEIEIVER
jgi:hypothetical protein